ncbi:hypothetical protein E1A91_D02G097300v1 [Gossypium mustelinum]|uniref:Uncharacterized protein n=1 Tax=Gossypium mustelinum TaxID=34275 RepID=A0A5D2VTP3_GOSMU|nr:hypothetical protein E1A91_D02G097300v1 [Gossypium mustelinum]
MLLNPASNVVANIPSSIDVVANNVSVPSNVVYVATFTTPVSMLPTTSYAKSFPNIFFVLDIYVVVFALTKMPTFDALDKQREMWVQVNKVCRHTIISIISNEHFYVYCLYDEAKEV